LMRSLQGETEAKRNALESFRGSMVHYAFDEHGCFAAQLALEVADRLVAAELLAELRDHVQEATWSFHANHVIQKGIAVLPPAAYGFIAEEIRGKGAAVARRRFGCRILCQLIDFAGDDPTCVELGAEVLKDVRRLCRDQFGHYVIQSVFEHKPHLRCCIVQALILELSVLASNKSARRVIETALSLGSTDEKQQICEAFLRLGPSGMVMLAMHRNGSPVTRAVLQSRVDAASAAAQQLYQAAAQLQGNREGRCVLKVLGKAFPPPMRVNACHPLVLAAQTG